MCEFNNNRPLPKYNNKDNSKKFSQILSQAKFLSELNDNNSEGEWAEDIDSAEEFECPFSNSSNSLPFTLNSSPFTLDLDSHSRDTGYGVRDTGNGGQGMEDGSDLEDLIEQELEQGQGDIEYTTEEPKVMVYLVGNFMN